ncbi:serine/threonine protein kinase [Isosphaera pallida ATCC 43644]|uniref:Serine/threonine protein kinase n=1 Tax=Isosphaera pallida (strain ATCC 43644 / DSM 9630 / IS1B) TaxID=575540 RepID=E8R0D7_ISOPI|nr:serine/threonine-protein kinase [Isosphaera pallida]ADV62264.1 serine/threonine protein kinase [Isosphaera pallida ATCC 43644]
MVNTEFDNRFVIESEINKNERAWVYRGVDKETGQEVAVKVLRPWTSASEKLESRFVQEFKLLKTLEHPNIVKVIQTGLTPNRFHYFAMELLKGQTLGQKLREVGRFPASKVADLLDQIAGAIDTAHARNVVHRDINPSNLMLHTDPTTGREVVKILDFGLAKIISENSGKAGAALTAAGVSVGTPAYMSPEQAMGKPIDKQSDIYSLGVTLYTLLTGVVPFERPNDYATMVAHVNDPIPWFSERGAANVVGPGVEAVVRMAMAKDPKDRPQSASELARLFREAVERPDRIPAAVQRMPSASTASTAPTLDPLASGSTLTAGAPVGANMMPVMLMGLVGLGLVVVGILWALR